MKFPTPHSRMSVINIERKLHCEGNENNPTGVLKSNKVIYCHYQLTKSCRSVPEQTTLKADDS